MLRKILYLVLLFCIFSRITLAAYEIDAVEYPKEILIERGWMKYFNVVVTNNGDLNLNNVTISFDGEFPQWFDTQSSVSTLQVNSNASFLVKLNVPANVEAKTYPFILNIKSKEVTNTKSFTVIVFKSEADAMLYQIQELETEIEDTQRDANRVENSGKNVTSATNDLNEAKNYLDISKDYINKEEYENATDLMINAENLIKKATYDLSIAPPKALVTPSGFPFEFTIPIPIIAIIIIFIFSLRSRKKKATTIKQPVVKIKEIGLGGKDVENLENELNDIENSRNLVEEEFKENLISKESYDELKERYERRISELKAKIERNKSI